MRVSRKNPTKNKDRVIEAAARLLCERGFEGIGIVEIMKAVGLTHGGFYRNFASKEDLATQATKLAAATMKATTTAELSQSLDEPFRALIERYVSHDHRQNPGSGCILPALAADASRYDNPALRSVFTAVIQDYLDQLTRLSSTMPETLHRRHPSAILSEMVGAVILSRVMADDEKADLLMSAVVTDIVGPPKNAV